MNADTKILMADGSSRQICNIQMGDIVLNRNGSINRVTNCWRGHELELLEIKLENGFKINCTMNQPILSSTGFQSARKLRVGDTIIDKDNKQVSVIEIKKLSEGYEVFNLDVEQHDSPFFANGFSVGDNWIQNTLY